MSEPGPKDLPKGLACMLASTIFFAVMNAAVKILNANGFSSMESVFARSFSMLLTIIFFCVFIKKESLKAKRPGGLKKLLIRSILGAISVACVFYNLSTISLGITIAFTQMIPIYSVLFALLTAQRPSPYAIASAGLGFVGVILIAQPNSGVPLINIIVGILAGLCATGAFITINALRDFYSSNVIIFYYAICLSAMGLVGMILPFEYFGIYGVGGFVWPSFFDLALIVFIGIFSTLAQSLLTKAYLFAKAHLVSPLGYFRIVWSVLLGVALGDAWPDFYALGGMILIISSGLLISAPVIVGKAS